MNNKTTATQNSAKSAAPKKKKITVAIVISVAVLCLCAAAFWFLHPHTFGEWQVIKEPTCVETGKEMRKCFCGENEVRTLDALNSSGHVKVMNKGYSATKTEDGMTDSVSCKLCGEVFVSGEVLYATGSQGLEYKIVSETACEIIGIGTCTDPYVFVPRYIDGYEVIAIAGDAFANCNGITNVTIDDSVKSIGSYAFYGCKGLTSITLGDGIASIDNRAFLECSKLGTITVSSGNTVYKSIGGVLFSNDEKTLVCYPANKPGAYVIPESVVTIGDRVFYNCFGLTDITIGANVESIGYGAFYNCEGLTEVIIPDSVTDLGDYAFANCTNLADVTVSKNITNIGGYSFANCFSLESIEISDKVEVIEDYAFSNCYILKSIKIGGGVTKIAPGAFYNCYELKNITFNGTAAKWKSISFGKRWNSNTPAYTVYCTNGSVSKNGRVTYN